MLRLEPRREPSRLMFYLTPLLAVLLTLLAGAALFAALGKPPLRHPAADLHHPARPRCAASPS